MSVFLEALANSFTPEILIWIVLGFLLGSFVGAVPGIGPELGILLVLPFTLGMEPHTALVFLVAIYTGGEYGGSIPAILLNTPGTASAAAVTIDGYAMSRQGKGVTALSISGTASALGNIIGGGIVLAALPLMALVVLLFGTPEYFMMAMLGLCTIAMVSSGGLLKGLMIAALGGLLATVGSNALIVDRRFTMGFIELNEGIALVPAFVGLFAIAEMVKISIKGGVVDKAEDGSGVASTPGRLEGFLYTLRRWPQVIKSSVLGFLIGVMPGQGGTVANYMAYMEAKASSKTPEKFGKGAWDGVLAPEAANNAVIPGSLVPTLTFGIPGSASSAVLLGGLLMHGMRPGATMFDQNLDVTYSIFLSIVISAVFIIAIGTGLANHIGKVPNIPVGILVPLIIAVSLIGTYSVEQNYFHVFQALLFGGVGLALFRFGFPIIPFILGFILGPIAELNLSRSMLISSGNPMIFLERPLSLVLVLLSVFVLALPFIKSLKERRRERLRVKSEQM